MDRMAEDTKERLTNLRTGLLRLHKNLLDSERAAYENDVERITSTGQYLNLVLNDPWFAWLRDLSQFIVLVDETLDCKEQPATKEDAERLIARARVLVSPSEVAANGAFGRKYFEAMQRDPGVVLAHRDMIRAFDSLG
jgi:hypothetical protein